MTVDVMFVTPMSAIARMFAISASRPCRIPAFTTRRRSSVQMSSASISAMASQSRAAKYVQKRSSTRLAAFSSRGAGRLSSSNLASAASRSASSNNSQRLTRSPSTVRSSIDPPLGVEALLRGPMRRLGDDRSEVAQPMHSLDVDTEVRREVPRGTDVCGHVTGRERDPAPVVDVHPVRRRRGKLVPVERGVAARDDRPRVRVGGRFAGEVAGVELGEGGVDVVEVEQRRAPTIRSSASISTTSSTSVWNASGRVAIREVGHELRTRRSPRVAMTVDVTVVIPISAIARTFAISASRPCRTPAFTTRRRSSMRKVVGQHLRHARPSRGPRSTSKSARTTWLAAFSSRGAGRLSSRTSRARRRGLPRRIFRSG